MTCRRIAASVLVLAFAAGAAGSAQAVGSPPLTPVVQPATVAAPGVRLAFANQRYRAQIFPSATSTTTSTTGTTVTYRTANDLITGLPIALRLDVYRPTGDSATSRPLLVWVHGGAFAGGNRSAMSSESIAYARLGYVTATISYRLDAGNKCLLVQAGAFTGAQLVTEQARCERAILAGSPPPAASQVSAVLAMSGCSYLNGSIDALDAPVAISASGGNGLVPFACSAATLDAAAAVGTPVVRRFFPGESGHAEGLYFAHQAEIDRAWRAFLIEHLELN